ncbi:hypothetical protein L2172_13525 [Pantoea agglomerans]|uniref:hypothetical protein n=1 Tax=Enterobacter agglomerans TaxID=549 RepID=UPI002023E657|nr:hypothetical protein [Pantoea agglomerans]MCL9651444.1 hypothetical protein [Pantoea agglomerans]
MREVAKPATFMFLWRMPIDITGVNVFTCIKKERNIASTIREGIMIDTEMGTWKEFIEAMLRNK